MCWTHCHGPVPLHARQRSWDRSWSPAGCSPRCWSPCRCSISETHLENSTQSVWSIQSTRLYQVINWCKYEKEWISAGTGAVAGIIVLVLVLMTKWGLILNKDTWFMAVHINSILSTLRAVSFQCMITYPSFNISLITIRTGKSLKLVLCTNHPVHLLQRTNTVPTPLLPFGKVYLTVWKPSPSIKQLSWSTPFSWSLWRGSIQEFTGQLTGTTPKPSPAVHLPVGPTTWGLFDLLLSPTQKRGWKLLVFKISSD